MSPVHHAAMRIASILVCALAMPAAAADERPLLALPHKLLYENALTEIPKEWRSSNGRWEIFRGTLVGAERAGDEYAAGMGMRLPIGDLIVQCEIKLDGAEVASIGLSDANGTAAHVGVRTKSIEVVKDDHDKEGPDAWVVFGRLKANIRPGTWHVVRLEIAGNEMLGKVDDIVAFGAHEQIGHPKSSINLRVQGESASFRNIKVWEAKPNPDWRLLRRRLPKGRPAEFEPPPRARRGRDR